MAKWIIFSAAIVFLTLVGLSLPGTAASAPALDSTRAAVKIVHTWQQTNGSSVYDATGTSLGTLIAPNIVLTHNHYGLTLGYWPSDTLVITDEAGHAWGWRAIDAQLIAIDAGTSLIWLPNELSLPIIPLAESADLHRLAVGRWLTVNYWDDNSNNVAQRDFQIVQIKDGIAQLADPSCIINSGDSGGGAYLSGDLVGNIWSINLDSDRRAAGSFNVALLPSQVRGYVK